MANEKRLASLLLIIPLLVFIVLPHCLLVPTDPDYWWHVTAGQHIVETGNVPHADPFTYTSLGKEWIAHEWLSEVLFFAAEETFGYVSNVIVFGLMLCLIWLIVYRIARERGLGEVGASVCATVWFLMSRASMNVRPQVWTVLFFALTVLILERYLFQQRKRQLYWLVPILLLWVNLHGGYVIGLTAIGVAAVASFVMAEPDARWCVAWPVVRILLVCCLAVLLNPEGADALLYPLRYAGTANASMSFIQEWQSPDFHQPMMLVSAVVLALLCVLPGKMTWWDALMVGGLAIGGLVSSRHLPLLGIVAMSLVAMRTTDSIPALAASLTEWTSLRLLWAFAVIIPLLGVVTACRATDGDQPLQTGQVASAYGYPKEAVSYLSDSGYSGNLLNKYVWGGYLIYACYPDSDQHVFVDGRADVHGDALIEDYFTIVGAAPGWGDVIDRYEIGTVLVDPGDAIVAVLEASPDWRQVFADDVAVVYERDAKDEQ